MNLTSRIESLTGVYGERLLISGQARAALTEPSGLRCVDEEAYVKGRRKPVQLFAP